MRPRVLLRAVSLSLACLLAIAPAVAQFRTLPQNAHFGRLGEPQQLPYLEINRKLVKLGPGGVIFDENNRSILHNALPANVRVAYTLDLQGDVSRIYILSAAEQAAHERKR